MEGFLSIRSNGTFGSVWKRRWFILEDDGTLRMFDTFDSSNDRVGKFEKQSRKIDQGWLVRRVTTDDKRENAFILTHDEHDSWYLSAETPQELNYWIQELTSIILTSNPESFDYTGKVGFYQTLGMTKEMSYGIELEESHLVEIFQRAKQAILGGGKSSNDPEVVEKLHSLKTAYYAVYKKHFVDPVSNVFRNVKYDCELTKSEDGRWGFTAAKSPTTGWICISAINERVIQASKFSPESVSRGHLRIHDAIYSIGTDVVQHWSLSRLQQRLSSFRVPPEESVPIVMCRRYLDDNEETHVDENLSEGYIISEEIKDLPRVSRGVKVHKPRGSIFGSWTTSANPAPVSAPTQAEAHDDSGTHDVNDADEVQTPRSRGILSRARASISWAKGTVLNLDEASAGVPSSEASNQELEDLRRKLDEAEAEAEEQRELLASVQKDLQAARTSEAHLLSEVNSLKKQLAAAEAPTSRRTYTLSSLGMHEKMAKLLDRYPLPQQDE